ncbi:hypothetical protein KW783_03985 [Candidatus Parcubacteria bacterium]|nr:hypothetical protein [Candidatus Parcubacteria bacterium]
MSYGGEITRVGDMHPNRLLKIWKQHDGDVVVTIEQNGKPIGDSDASGNPRSETARIEFCMSAGRSQKTRRALMALFDAIKEDNDTHPIVVEKLPEPVRLSARFNGLLYLILINSQEHWMTIDEAGKRFDSGTAAVEIGNKVMVQATGETRLITDEEHGFIAKIADSHSASK